MGQQSSQSKVLIFNAIPTNNGDAALVFTLYKAFLERGYSVKIASHYYKKVRSLYPEFNIVRELGDYNWLKKIPYNGHIKNIITPLLFLFSRSFRSCDILVASPGGYINSYYGFTKVAITLITAKLLGKRTGIYSQSVGPLNNGGKRLMRFLSKYIDVLYTRDSFSYSLVDSISIDKKHYLTEDAAFLIPFNQTAHDFRLRSECIIAVSVRYWKHDDRSKEKYFSLIRLFVKSLIRHGYLVEFISTCQGLSEYIDDSKAAIEIVSQLDDEVKSKVTVNGNYYKLDDFQKYITKFRCVIGTRLHMCILSMLSGVPSLNISYEIKGKEVYNYCGLSEYSIDYNEELEVAQVSLNTFLKDLEEIRAALPSIMNQRNDKANRYFNEFIELMK